MEKKINKPNLDLEVEVKVTGLQKLENNMEDVKQMALALQEYYKSEPFIEEGTEIDFEDENQMKELDEKRKQAKEERTKVNTFQKSIEDKFKEALDMYNKPIETTTKLKIETIQVLKGTSEYLKSQVEIVDSQLLTKKIEKFKKYFVESATKEKIDFITYDDMKQNVTLSASIKSLKKEIDDFISKVNDELKLIDSEEYKNEILVEYKKSLNVANAITTVKNRMKEIEEVKAKELLRQEQLKQQEEVIQKVEEVLERPKEVEIISKPIIKVESELITSTITVKNETKERLQAIIKFLEEGGYDYE